MTGLLRIKKVIAGESGLRSRGETAEVGYCHAKVLVRIHGRVVDADFVVKMGTGGASAEADVAEDIAAVDVLAGGYAEAGEVAVAGGDSVAVIHRDSAAIASEEVCKRYCAVGGGQNGLTYSGGNVYAGVECAFTVEWINALTECAGNLAFDRP